MSLQGYALTAEISTEVVSAYAASLQSVPAVVSAPGWFVVGSFFLPLSVQARLEAIAAVSAPGLTGTLRLYDPSPGVDAPVSGSDVQFTTEDHARVLGGAVTLQGNRTYRLQMQVVGATGFDKFGSLHTASLVGA
jgi:hypothetical protein